jgi:hypothetical protein
MKLRACVMTVGILNIHKCMYYMHVCLLVSGDVYCEMCGDVQGTCMCACMYSF